MMNKYNIKDIARMAGVSVGAASMVLNDKWAKKVKPAIADHVKSIAAKYNYTINPLGRGLQLNRFFKIALVINSHSNVKRVIGTFSLYDFIAQASEKLSREGYSLDIIRINCEEESSKSVTALPLTCDAMIFISWERKSIVRLLKKTKWTKPYIVVGTDLNNSNWSYTYRDMKNQTDKAIKHFLDNGHASIGFVRTQGSKERFIEKLTGYKVALNVAGIRFNRAMVFQPQQISPFKIGFEAGSYFFSRQKKQPTAIFCEDNLDALGLLWFCDKHGIKVPEQLEIIGYGDQEIAEMSVKLLSYIRIPSSEIANYCIDYILNTLNSSEKFVPVQKCFRENLVLNNTTR